MIPPSQVPILFGREAASVQRCLDCRCPINILRLYEDCVALWNPRKADLDARRRRAVADAVGSEGSALLAPEAYSRYANRENPGRQDMAAV